jgi:hypothetical protein
VAHVEWIILAEEGYRADNKFYLKGAGFTGVVADAFPYVLPPLTAAYLIFVPDDEVGTPQQIRFVLTDLGGIPMAEAMAEGIVETNHTGGPDILKFISGTASLYGATFPSPGMYAIVCEINGVERKRIPLEMHLIGNSPREIADEVEAHFAASFHESTPTDATDARDVPNSAESDDGGASDT